jgi:TRAP transporter 4TM/12TM fusion protein
VMGAAAFLIAEYVGISYAEVVKHAFFPALLTYGSLFYIVDIEAMKMGLKGLPVTFRQSFAQTMLRSLMTICGFIVFCGLVYYGIGWTKDLFGSAATTVIVLGVLVAYVALVAFRAQYPDLPLDDPSTALIQIPRFGETARTGLHFLLPVFVLIWCLMVEELSPGLSGFWGTAALVFLLVTQRPLTAFFRKQSRLGAELRGGIVDLGHGLTAAARNMTTVGIATATAGIIVGTVLLTGIGLVMTELVELVSGGSLTMMLLLTAVICLILGMGMPTTASYVVVATLMAPVIVDLAAQNDLAVPLVAVHLFVFYFGLMADVTPPVGLAAYAAAAISGADPVKTGVQGFKYEIRTALLPFVFIFNPQLLMIDIHSPIELALILVGAIAAMAAFVAATQGWFLIKSRWYETIVLLLACFLLFRPGFWLDLIEDPYRTQPAGELRALADATQPGRPLWLRVDTTNAAGDPVEKLIRLDLGEGANGIERLKAAGLEIDDLGDAVMVANVRLGSAAEKYGILPGDTVLSVAVPAERMSPRWFMLPGFLLIGLVALNQWRRRSTLILAPSPGR